MEYINMLVTLILILVVFYFAQYPRRKEEKEIKKMQQELKPGDCVITYSRVIR